jgi:phosphoribosyl 1,2-cyclic phosphodiesterase
MKISVLASGSSGNSILIACGTTDVLIDVGLSGRQLAMRLTAIGKSIEEIDAVLISHEHTDHIKGLRFIEKRTAIPVYLNSATSRAVADRGFEMSRIKIFSNNAPFTLGEITVIPFSVMHDAADPVGFSLSTGEVKATIATDLGHATHLVKEMMRDSHAIVIEANHDPQLLLDHSRPWALKQRIKSRQGHLSNESAAELLGEVATKNLRAVFLAHISRDCNRPDLGLATVSSGLARIGLAGTPVIVASPDAPTDLIEIGFDAVIGDVTAAVERGRP